MRGQGLEHLNKRQRATKTLELLGEIEGVGEKTLQKLKFKGLKKHFELYPSNKFWIRSLDKMLVVIATIGPLSVLPQIWKIFAEQSAAGVSISSWAMCAILDIPWIFYGLVHKDKPIVISYTLWLLANLAVVFGALMFP